MFRPTHGGGDLFAVGVDACPGGWVFATLRGSEVRAGYIQAIGGLVHALSALGPAGVAATEIEPAGVEAEVVEAVGVDIPIGLVEAGHRAADVTGRKALGARSSTLFLTPVRAAVEAPDHATANAIERRINGSGTSRQAFGLSARILEVERWLLDAPCAVFEVHPELSFATLMGVVPKDSKRTWSGAVSRSRALRAAGIDISGIDPSATGPAGIDDVLDAIAIAWSARRAVAGEARSYPDPPEMLPSGRLMAIWA
jgi:predicted RNase H-like nuclease